ncbi:unnamed protein product [Moneuplotes crassus]|uniref:Uncharacterized protein n=1 Tax=Euplotes crassus TaxID=5936 RepID=A0AAD1UDJ7_EUPCR|nr:unnamed protein product [Moneuplotes crassus]
MSNPPLKFYQHLNINSYKNLHHYKESSSETDPHCPPSDPPSQPDPNSHRLCEGEQIDFDRASTKEIKEYLEKERKGLRLEEIGQSSGQENDDFCKRKDRFKDPPLCVRTKRIEGPCPNIVTSLTQRNQDQTYNSNKLAPFTSRNNFDGNEGSKNFPSSTRDRNNCAKDERHKSFVFKSRQKKKQQRRASLHEVQSYQRQTPKTCSTRKILKQCILKNNDKQKPAQLVSEEAEKVTIKNDNLIINEMRNEISSMRKEFMNAIKEIKTSVENYSAAGEKASKYEFSATGQSYLTSKPDHHELVLDDEYSKQEIKRQSREHFGRRSAGTRSSSVQNNNSTLFYKHAFNEENANPNSLPKEKLIVKELPCSKCVTLVGNAFLQTFQTMIDGLATDSNKARGVDFSVLEAQTDQIKESINRLKYVSMKTEIEDATSPQNSYRKPRKIKPTTKAKSKCSSRPVTDYHDSIDPRTPNTGISVICSKDFDNKENQFIRNIVKKSKKSKKERKASKKQKLSKNLIEQNQWASRVLSQR